MSDIESYLGKCSEIYSKIEKNKITLSKINALGSFMRSVANWQDDMGKNVNKDLKDIVSEYSNIMSEIASLEIDSVSIDSLKILNKNCNSWISEANDLLKG
ncbi:MAG: hypothetical protein K5765_08335 [Clostridia bacterium]|nr:hypothetical protein [Clostridia bacterium]